MSGVIGRTGPKNPPCRSPYNSHRKQYAGCRQLLRRSKHLDRTILSASATRMLRDDQLRRNGIYLVRALPVRGLPRWTNQSLVNAVLWRCLVLAALHPDGRDRSAKSRLWARARLSCSIGPRPPPRCWSSYPSS